MMKRRGRVEFYGVGESGEWMEAMGVMCVGGCGKQWMGGGGSMRE